MRNTKINGFASASAMAIAAAAALSAAPAHSQQIEEIVVTARKTAENLQRVPVAVTAISGEQMRAANIVNASDLRLIAPGLQANPPAADNTAVTFKIRGISAGGPFGESAVATYVDGVYRQLQYGLGASLHDIERAEVLKGPQGTLYGKNAAAGLVHMITRKPDLEGIGGYASARFGTYSGGGSGNRAATDFRGAINLPVVAGKAALRVAADVDNSDGYGRNGLGRKLNTRDNWSVRAHFLYAPNDDWQFLLSGDYASLRSSGPTQRLAEVDPFSFIATSVGVAAGFINPLDIPSQFNGFTPGATYFTGQPQAVALMSRDLAPTTKFYDMNGSHGPDARVKDKGISLTIDGELGGGIGIKSITAYRTLQRSSFLDDDGTPLYREAEFSTRSDLKFFSEELNIFGDLGPVQWRTGGYYNHYTDNQGAVPGIYSRLLTSLFGTLTAYDAPQTNETLGFFVHGNVKLTDALSFSAGARWSQDTRVITPRDAALDPVTFAIVGCSAPGYGGTVANNCVGPKIHHKDNGISYDASLSYQVNPDALVYATIARGYRAGNVGNSGQYETYEPEYVQNFELGLKSEWFDRTMLLNVAGYYSKYTDMQRAVVAVLPGGGTGFKVDNAAKAHIWGAEIEALVRPAKGLELAVNYAYSAPQFDNYVDGGVDVSDSVFEVAKHTVNTHVQYGFDLGNKDRLTARVDYVWQSKIFFGGFAPLFPSEKILRNPAYGLVNARIAYDSKVLDATVSLFARNLTGEKYYVAATDFRPLGISLLFPGEPRFIGIEITKKFGSDR